MSKASKEPAATPSKSHAVEALVASAIGVLLAFGAASLLWWLAK